MHALAKGLIVGAVGTTALNLVTYADMVVRARPASELPAKAAKKMADDVHVDLGSEEQIGPRSQGLGALMGFAVGLGCGAVYGVVRSRIRIPFPAAALGLAAAAMANGDAPLVAQGLTDPKKWGVAGWLSDVLPHVAYGVAGAAAYELIA
jgi:hypothetical protein